MPKKPESDEISRIHLHVFTEDLKKLDRIIPYGMTRAEFLRTIIHKYCNAMEQGA